jgi:hypothetical protein
MNRQANAGLFCELYWGETVTEAWSFGPELSQVHAASDGKAPLPLYGFTLPEEPFLFAERLERGYRIFIPPRVKLERSTKGDDFHEVPESQLSQHQGRRCLELNEGSSLRISEVELRLLIQPSEAKVLASAPKAKDLTRVAIIAAAFVVLPLLFILVRPSAEQLSQNNARAISAAKEKDLERRKALGIDTPLKPLSENEQKPKTDGGTQITLPTGGLSVQ